MLIPLIVKWQCLMYKEKEHRNKRCSTQRSKLSYKNNTDPLVFKYGTFQQHSEVPLLS